KTFAGGFEMKTEIANRPNFKETSPGRPVLELESMFAPITMDIFQPSLRDLSRTTAVPNLKTLGYSRSSLRNGNAPVPAVLSPGHPRDHGCQHQRPACFSGLPGFPNPASWSPPGCCQCRHPCPGSGNCHHSTGQQYCRKARCSRCHAEPR